MVLSPDFLETLQKIAEQQKQIQKALSKTNLNSPATKAIASVQRHTSHVPYRLHDAHEE